MGNGNVKQPLDKDAQEEQQISRNISKKMTISGDNFKSEYQNIVADDQIDEVVNHALTASDLDLVSKIEIYVAAEELPNMDFTSKSDPYVQCQTEGLDGEWNDVGQTEILPDNLNPRFAKSLIIQYSQKTPPRVRFIVYDVDACTSNETVTEKDYMGEAEFNLKEILDSSNMHIMIGLTNKKKKKEKKKDDNVINVEAIRRKGKFPNGVLILRGFECGSDNYNYIGYDQQGELYPIYQTLNQKNNKKSDFPEFFISENKISAKQLKFEIYEFNIAKVQQKQIGEYDLLLQELYDSRGSIYTIKLMKGKNYVGTLRLLEFKKFLHQFTFLNYIYGGCKLKIIIAIDFSHLNFTDKKMKNYHLEKEENNEYIQSLRKIKIINFLCKVQYFEITNKIPVYGFGAKLAPYQNFHSNCFALNGDYFEPEISDIESIILTYKKCLDIIKFSGPTIYSEVIELALNYARSKPFNNKSQTYYMLMIFSKGDLFPKDLQKTQDLLVEASELPISIVQVGVGENSNFDYIPLLQNNQEFPLIHSQTCQQAEREVLHFINYFWENKYELKLQFFAKSLLKKLPDQFLRFMRKRNIKPVLHKPSMKIATEQFIQTKKKMLVMDEIQEWLDIRKEQLFIRLTQYLGHDKKIILGILEEGLPCIDINYILERISYQKHLKSDLESFYERMQQNKSRSKIKTKKYVTMQNRRVENPIKKQAPETFQISKSFLDACFDKTFHMKKQKKLQAEEWEAQQHSPQKSIPNNSQFQEQKKQPPLKNNNPQNTRNLIAKAQQIDTERQVVQKKNQQFDACQNCQRHKIDVIFMPCGHVFLCHACYKQQRNNICQRCKQTIFQIAFIQNEKRDSRENQLSVNDEHKQKNKKYNEISGEEINNRKIKINNFDLLALNLQQYSEENLFHEREFEHQQDQPDKIYSASQQIQNNLGITGEQKNSEEKQFN